MILVITHYKGKYDLEYLVYRKFLCYIIIKHAFWWYTVGVEMGEDLDIDFCTVVDLFVLDFLSIIKISFQLVFKQYNSDNQ